MAKGAPTVRTTYKNVSQSDAADQLIDDEMAKLEQYFHRITSVQVIVEKLPGHHLEGSPYDVRILLHVPGNEIVVHSSAAGLVRIAIQEAFRKAGRRLQEYARLLRA